VSDPNVKGRTCANCACAYVIEPPRVPTAEQLRVDPDFANRKPQRICRLNPPVVIHMQVQTSEGLQTVPKLMQAPTDDYFSCWHWRAEGTLPGDQYPEVDSQGIPMRGLVVS
jgi:hypothetical protein